MRFVMQGLAQVFGFLLFVLFALPLTGNVALAQQLNDSEDAALVVDAEQAGEEQSEAERAAQRARETEYARELELHRQAINDLQGDLGIYAPQLQEAYGELAALHAEFEDYESAAGVYNDALQISRINTGLYSEDQLPVIEALITTNGQMRNWEKADDLQELTYHISSRLYSIEDLAYLAAAEKYGEWKLRLLRENLLDLNYRGYSNIAEDLSEFYERLIEDLDTQRNTRPANLISILQGKSEADLVLVRAIASTPYTAFQGTVSQYVYEQRCRNVRTSSGQIVRECVNVQVENPRYRQSQRDAKQIAMSRGTRAVQESIDRLRQIALEGSDLGALEREQLESQIAELETETYQLLRQSRSRRLF